MKWKWKWKREGSDGEGVEDEEEIEKTEENVGIRGQVIDPGIPFGEATDESLVRLLPHSTCGESTPTTGSAQRARKSHRSAGHMIHISESRQGIRSGTYNCLMSSTSDLM